MRAKIGNGAVLLMAVCGLVTANPANAQRAPLSPAQLEGRELECIAGLTMYGLYLDETAKDPSRPDEQRQERIALSRKNDMQLFWFVGKIGSWPIERRDAAAFDKATKAIQSLDPDETIALIEGCGDWFEAEGLGTLQGLAGS